MRGACSSLLSLSSVLAILGCGGETASSDPRDASGSVTYDAGARDAPPDQAIDLAAPTPDAAPNQATLVPDAPTPDVLAADTADAAAADASDDGASPDVAAPASTVIYGTWNGSLVRIDPATGARTDVGVLKNPQNAAQTFTDVVMAWSGPGDTALATLGFMAPRLATVNLCNAAVTLGPSLTRPASPNLVVEAIARHPNGTWYVASGNNAQTLSPNLGTLDPTTGIITNLGGSVTTGQNDIDMLFFKDTTLYGADVVTTMNLTELYTLDLVTGVDSNNLAVNQVDEALRIVWDAVRGKAFSWRLGDRQLLTFDLATGAVTPIGETHPATAYANATIRAFFVAPAPTCP